MEYVVLFYNGLKVIFLVENNLCNIMAITFIIRYYLRSLSGLYLRSPILMIYSACNVSKFLELIALLLMTLIFSIRILILPI